MIVYLFGYILTFIFLVVWNLKRALDRQRGWPGRSVDNEDKVISVLISLALAFVWPVVVLVFGAGYLGIWFCNQVLKVMVKKKWV